MIRSVRSPGRLHWPLMVASAAGAGFFLSLAVNAFARRLEAPSHDVPTMTALIPPAQTSPGVVLLVHGGAGTIRRSDLTPEREQEYRAAIARALQVGYAILHRGGSSVSAVVAAIKVLENSPLFNAGRGAVFTRTGSNELDAALMDGKTLNAGAVAAVQHIANPIELAWLVMEKSPHVLLVGEGAEQFAREQGMALVPQTYFFTERRWQEYERAREADRKAGARGRTSGPAYDVRAERKYGTVGAVALDAAGNLAAGTSTGGLTYKMPGRVGDSPIVGAGTYANNTSCAVSATGQGEYFMRNVVAHDICARVAYQHVPLEQAVHDVIGVELPKQGGDGGVIALDTAGHFTMQFNTEGMYRGVIDAEGKASVAIFRAPDVR